MTFKDSNNNIIDNNRTLGTGDKIIITITVDEEYIAVVKGDLSGDGRILMNDVMKMANYLFDNNLITEKHFLRASDIDDDGNIKMNDVMKVANYLVTGEGL